MRVDLKSTCKNARLADAAVAVEAAAEVWPNHPGALPWPVTQSARAFLMASVSRSDRQRQVFYWSRRGNRGSHQRGAPTQSSRYGARMYGWRWRASPSLFSAATKRRSRGSAALSKPYRNYPMAHLWLTAA